MKSNAGISLLEVLIALVITAIITTAVLRVYVTQHQNYLIQDDITEIQQSARAAIDELSRHIRMAGNDVPPGLPSLIAADTDPDTITISYRSDECATTIAAPMPLPSSELKCTGDLSCFYDGQWVYIYEPKTGIGEFFVITEVQSAAYHLQHNTMTLSKAYEKDAIIISMNRYRFFIDHTTDPEHPNLMIEIPGLGPQVYAENISDLQFQYRLKNGLIVDEPVVAADVREVLISVTGRSRHENYEDPNSDYRMRTYSSSVNLRNF
jgi:hypothetical protein